MNGSSGSGEPITLDSRLLNAMKRLRMENIQLQKQLKALQQDFGQASSQATDSAFRTQELEMKLASAEQQLQELAELKLRLQSLEITAHQWESQCAAQSQLVHQQGLEMQDLRTQLRERNEEITRLQHANAAGREELEKVKAHSRQVLVQHYEAMKMAQEQAQDAYEEARRSKAQLDAIRPPANGLRKVLPPRSLFPKNLPGGK